MVDSSMLRGLVWVRAEVEESLVSDPGFPNDVTRTVVKDLRFRPECPRVVLTLYEWDNVVLTENYSG